jgi:hypothetical protein
VVSSRGVAQKRASQGKASAFAAGQARAVFAQPGAQAQGRFPDAIELGHA